MNVFFDIDYTLLGDDGSLRPGARELFERLVADGHTLYIWSGRGVRWPEVRRSGLDDLVAGVFEKPLYRHHERLEVLGVPVSPDFTVDDHHEIIDAFGGAVVRPYWRAPRNDLEEASATTEMERVYQAIAGAPANGQARRTDSLPRP